MGRFFHGPAQRKSEAQAQLVTELEIHNKITQIFLSVPDEEMYRDVLDIVLEALESKSGIFGYVDEEGALVCPSITKDLWDQCQVPDKEVTFPRESWGGIWGRAMIEQETLLSNGPLEVPEGHFPIHRALDVPLIRQGQTIGDLLVANKETDYDEEDRRLLESLAHRIAPILSARLQRDREERERERAMAKLRESENRFRTIFDLSQDGMVLADPETRRLVMANRAACRMLDRGEEEIPELGLMDIHPETDLPYVMDQFERQKKGQISVAADIPVQKKDGSVLFADVNASLLTLSGRPLMLGIFRDITERRRAQETLRLQAGLLSKVAEGIYVVGVDDLIIKWTNERFAEMFGYEPGELVGKLVDIVNAPTEKTPAETRESIVAVLEEAGEWHGEVRNIRRDGTHFWCYANVSVFDHPEHGKVYMSVHTDITDRKRAEAGVLDSRDRLRTLSAHLDEVREEERTKLARELHEEVGQALTAMSMDLAMVENEIPVGQEQLIDRLRSMIDITQDSVDRVNRMSSELWSPILDILGLEAAVETEVWEYRERLGMEIGLELELGELKALPERDLTVHRILRAALSNVRQHAEASRLEVSLRVVGERLVLEVLDDGIGITDGQLQDDRSFGLIGMRERIERLGGTMVIERRPTGGTRIRAEAPVAPLP